MVYLGLSSEGEKAYVAHLNWEEQSKLYLAAINDAFALISYHLSDKFNEVEILTIHYQKLLHTTFALIKMTSTNACAMISRPIPDAIDSLSKTFNEFSRRMNDRLDLQNVVSNTKAYAQDHPTFSVILATTIVISALPILAFLTFIVATLGITLLGFLFVEGTLLTVGTVFLSGILFFVGFLALGFSAFVAATWFAVNKVFNAVSVTSEKLGLGKLNQQLSLQAIKPTIANGLHHYD
ncbi:hypothetical protein CHUAL_011866 [Chamberlinius hualienensis]